MNGDAAQPPSHTGRMAKDAEDAAMAAHDHVLLSLLSKGFVVALKDVGQRDPQAREAWLAVSKIADRPYTEVIDVLVLLLRAAGYQLVPSPLVPGSAVPATEPG